MQSLSHYASFLQRSTLGPAALLAAAVVTTYLLARKPRASVQPRPAAPVKSRYTAGVIRWLILGFAAISVLLAMGIDLHGLWSMLTPPANDRIRAPDQFLAPGTSAPSVMAGGRPARPWPGRAINPAGPVRSTSCLISSPHP